MLTNGKNVDRRWHDWVIALAIVAIAAVGVVTLWGEALSDLLAPAARNEAPKAQAGSR